MHPFHIPGRIPVQIQSVFVPVFPAYYLHNIIILSGTSYRISSIINWYSYEHNLITIPFDAEWGKYGQCAGNISNEKLLADSGYGQGEVLVNPIHMASIYSAFANDGNMVKYV